MAAVLSMYSNAILKAFTGGAAGGVDWDTNAIKMALMTAYTPSEDHATWTVALAAGTQHAAANGYSTGGAALGTKTNTNTAGVHGWSNITHNTGKSTGHLSHSRSADFDDSDSPENVEDGA